MQQEINESIAVVAIFKNGKLVPHSFSWQGRKYRIDKISLEHQEKRGTATLFCFSVSASGNTYELSFNNQTLVWKLEKIWLEAMIG